jgi:hypothetical protein
MKWIMGDGGSGVCERANWPLLPVPGTVMLFELEYELELLHLAGLG